MLNMDPMLKEDVAGDDDCRIPIETKSKHERRE